MLVVVSPAKRLSAAPAPLPPGIAASSPRFPAQTAQSQALSKALKAEGFKFCGPTIVYAFMQASGLVNDHLAGCRFG